MAKRRSIFAVRRPRQPLRVEGCCGSGRTVEPGIGSRVQQAIAMVVRAMSWNVMAIDILDKNPQPKWSQGSLAMLREVLLRSCGNGPGRHVLCSKGLYWRPTAQAWQPCRALGRDGLSHRGGYWQHCRVVCSHVPSVNVRQRNGSRSWSCGALVRRSLLRAGVVWQSSLVLGARVWD